MPLLKPTLYVIAVVQIVLGAVLLVPGGFSGLMSLEAAPGWVDWILAMFAARAIGFGFGMFLAARNPIENRSWIVAMVGVQAIDWLATIAYLATGTVTLGQVTTAVFLPVVFILILGRYLLATRDPVTPRT